MEMPLKKLGDVCHFVRGPFGGSLKKSCFKSNGNAVYEQQHAIYNQFNKIRYFVDDEKFEEMKRFELKSGDLIMSCSGTMGKVAIVPDGIKKGIINQALLKLTPSKDLDVKYLRYWMSSNDFQESLAKYTVGAAIKNVASVKILKQIEAPLPLLEEQKQIVALLDQAFTAIDQAKANIEKNIVNAKELFQSKLNAIFSQKGDGWKEKSIDEISKVVNGYSFKSKDFSADNEIKSIKITNVGIMEFVEDSSNNLPLSFLQEYSKVQVHVGDLVLALTRTIISGGLKVARVPESYHNSLLNQRVAAIVPNLSLVNSDYLYYYFSSDIVYNYVLSNVNTLMQPNLSIKDLKRMTIPITSLEGQRKISIQIEGLSEKTNLLISNYEVKLNNIEELKKSILQKAFSGELTQKEVVV